MNADHASRKGRIAEKPDRFHHQQRLRRRARRHRGHTQDGGADEQPRLHWVMSKFANDAIFHHLRSLSRAITVAIQRVSKLSPMRKESL